MVLVLVFFQLDLITNNTVRWVVVAALLISFIDVVIKISIKLWKFINIELVILKMEKHWIQVNYEYYREEYGKKQVVRDTTMQELLAGVGLESLDAIRKKLAERALASGTKKKKRYLKRQLKEIDRKIVMLRDRESAGSVLADICSETAVNGQRLLERGVTLLTDVLPRADPDKIPEYEKKKKK